jgi:DNA-binding response OmpR family regulator
MAPCILSMGYDPHLMIVRTLILQRAGYVVDEVYERAAALSRAQCDSVDALLICHTVPKFETQWLIANVREKRRLMPILCLTLGIDELPGDGCIEVENGPEELLHALRRAIELSRFQDAS